MILKRNPKDFSTTKTDRSSGETNIPEQIRLWSEKPTYVHAGEEYTSPHSMEKIWRINDLD